ncbi:maltokinase N-terminal cap-like domain-containing protein [Microbacterium sp. ASV49]|uniref:Maltokinase n=1 Tax=Microbacterium candidum TaxID=3041922 RepID=A0ABT7N2H2_9MICO|nr:phosphotransferase [Microbacterium sp. ASV49]MDL9980903.1 aminoglycoside phosphotransferase [Microbacterium sp. ASV49]
MDNTLACLAAWIPQQRWYAAKGRTPALRIVASIDLDAVDADIRVRTLLVADDASRPPVLYQVPVVERPAGDRDLRPRHTIGEALPGMVLVDGVHDPAYARALLQLVTAGGRRRSDDLVLTGTGVAASALSLTTRAEVLTGEQSNTSLVYRDPGSPLICKLYRKLQPGLNPDVELQVALADAGSTRVPRPAGWLEGSWAAEGGEIESGSLAFAQEFLPDVEDAWRVALRAAAEGEDFQAGARELGAATAEVHLTLARALPMRAAGAAERDAVTATWHRRLEDAIGEVPELASRRAAIETGYARARDEVFPPLQRIHGDYHLGQVVRIPGRGWVLLDFEGEPMRPMQERRRPDLALRDIAGMLRSFDYVAGSLGQDMPERADAVDAWARAARAAYLEGYAAASGLDLVASAPLLHALELDKAVYETLYEARNRPSWIGIPLRAVDRLTGVVRPSMA